jgi:hypothetical protein
MAEPQYIAEPDSEGEETKPELEQLKDESAASVENQGDLSEESEDSEVEWHPVASSDAVWYGRDVKVPIDRLEWDATAKHGQIRIFDEEYGRKRILEMMSKQPVGLLNVVLVCKDHSGMLSSVSLCLIPK